MEETLRQLGDLLLGSIPTILLFLILYAAYRVLVHTPLDKILAERRSRTEGAIEKARADIAAAEARTAEYEQRLREARAAIFQAQQARRQEATQARAALVAEARAKADAQVKQAKVTLEQEMAAAKNSLHTDVERLASEIIANLLRQARVAQHPAGGGK
jgi:F-type H+-transporting ATPase subunit b